MENLLKYILLPSNLIMFGGVVGGVLLCIRPVRRWGSWVSICSFALYALIASGPIAFLLLGWLEYRVPSVSGTERSGIHTIVVLAAYAEPNLEIPLSSRISSGTAYRLLETLALFESAQDGMVIVSGGGEVPGIMREVLIAAGVPSGQIVVDSESDSTYESALHLASRLGDQPFLLVTSAGHMPRAIGVFQKAGTDPRPVSTHYMTKRNWLAIQYFPLPAHLGYSDLAISEYAALLWYRIKGWI